MSDYDNFLRTQKILNKQLQTYFNSPVIKALIDQQKVAQAVSSSMKNIISNSGINFTYKSIHDINASLAQSLSQSLKLSDEVSKNISQLVLSAQLTDSFSSLFSQYCKELSYPVEKQFTTSPEPLLTNISQIQLHEDYVSIPEALIPEGFDYAEVETEDPSESSPIPIPCKKLSRSKALTLLTFFVTILTWLFPNPFQLGETSTPLTQEQGEIIIDYLSKISEYIKNDSTLNSESVPQEVDLFPSGIQYSIASPGSADQSECEIPPTCDSTQSLSKAE